MDYEELNIQRKQGLSAEDMQEEMLSFMKNNNNAFFKNIAHLIEDYQCKLTSTSLERHHVYTRDGGGSWVYIYETPTKKLPFHLIYVYAPPSDCYFDSSHKPGFLCDINDAEEDVIIFFCNREKEIRDDIENAIKHTQPDDFLDFLRSWKPNTVEELIHAIMKQESYEQREQRLEMLKRELPQLSMEERLKKAVQRWKKVNEIEEYGKRSPQYHSFQDTESLFDDESLCDD